MQETDEITALSAALARECEARQEAEMALEVAERSRQQFVSLLTHELRVPMTSIKGYTDLLIQGVVGPVSDAQMSFLRTIRANVERMAQMVSHHADTNKLEAGTLTFLLSAVSLQDVLDEVLGALEKALVEKQQTWRLEIPANLPPIDCDRSRLVQVLENVIRNAHCYTPEGGTITIAAEAASHDADSVRIIVHDNGIGILPEEQAHVFEKFFRASDEETRQVPGNGLALYLCRLLVEQQRGRIWFESVRGTGSTFYITLPVHSRSGD